jgi:CRISP-associated protein Cas1
MAIRKTHPMLDLAAWVESNGDPSLLIADGHNVTVNVRGGSHGDKGGPVEGGVLLITDGPMGNKRERTIARVPRTIKTLAILTNHGYVSLDAMKWLNECEITWFIVDGSGPSPQTLATSGKPVNPIYMRRQALCGPGMPAAMTGTKIMARLITAKLEGQAYNCERILRDTETAKLILAQIDKVAVAPDVTHIMGHEGVAGRKYWTAWRGLALAWITPPLQAHWRVFPSRDNLLRDWSTNRNATDPVNAMLNFAYKCAETECTLACYAYALSPTMGVGHVDRAGRDSFSLDLIEVMRPLCDRVILGILAEKLDDRWFSENRQGIVSCRAPLTHRILAEVHAEAIEIIKALVTVIPLLNSPQSCRIGVLWTVIDSRNRRVLVCLLVALPRSPDTEPAVTRLRRQRLLPRGRATPSQGYRGRRVRECHTTFAEPNSNRGITHHCLGVRSQPPIRKSSV